MGRQLWLPMWGQVMMPHVEQSCRGPAPRHSASCGRGRLKLVSPKLPTWSAANRNTLVPLRRPLTRRAGCTATTYMKCRVGAIVWIPIPWLYEVVHVQYNLPNPIGKVRKSPVASTNFTWGRN